MKSNIFLLIVLFMTEMNGQNSEDSNYWKLTYSSDEKEIGKTYPQIQTSEGGWWDVLDSLSVYGQITFGKSPTITPPFGTLILENMAKRTDFLSAAQFSHHGFIMSLKAKMIFEKYKLGKHWFFPVDVKHKNVIYQYYVFHTNNSQLNLFDLSKSEFEFRQRVNGGRTVDKVVIKSEKSLLEKIESYRNSEKGIWTFQASLLHFKPNLNNVFDLIADRNINIFSYISTNLKTELLQNNITGISINQQSLIK
ncbi:hypothetical protein B4Q04_22260 [Zobellia sp. OII3]|uniref:hypothetical protein n=1 Tax=Zobellia sp. OII3 TaxID=2034520 RepID=UPI000B76620F|nr:hypothetical protein [Zobellia sp. OII3]OWW23126.1 hypothetical protein B4Q04_22260 [Zobellia sp. OII3]